MSINFKNNKCCGCMACMNICPKDAITITKDDKGFIYPKIDKEKCISCHLCEKVCNFNKEDREENNTKKAYSLIINNKNDLYYSTSGGAFTVLSDLIFKKNGFVFGAIMDENFNVYHIETNNKKGRDKMRGSKYVQSNINLIYRTIRQELNNKKEILFVGSPCQIGGLKSFLMKEYNNLITVEFLCHGVPNNDFFKAHIKYLEAKNNNKAKEYEFRSKRYAWHSPGIEYIKFSDRKVDESFEAQAYTHFFHENISLRPSCYNCTYRKYRRCADITIADFWGYGNVTGKKNIKGVSLVLANNDKGIDFINEIDKNQAQLEEVQYEKVKRNINIGSIKIKYNIDEFWDDYLKKGYGYLVNKYYNQSSKAKAIFKVKKEFRKLVAKIVCKPKQK